MKNRKNPPLKGRDCLHPNLEGVSDPLQKMELKDPGLKAGVSPNLMSKQSPPLREGIVYSVKQLPDTERPRERLRNMGPDALSTAELIAVILGSGTKESPVLQLAQEIVARFDTLDRLSEATVEEFCQIKGIGVTKAIQLRAALNLGIRASRKTPSLKQKIGSPLQAYHLTLNYRREQLCFLKTERSIVRVEVQ